MYLSVYKNTHTHSLYVCTYAPEHTHTHTYTHTHTRILYIVGVFPRLKCENPHKFYMQIRSSICHVCVCVSSCPYICMQTWYTKLHFCIFSASKLWELTHAGSRTCVHVCMNKNNVHMWIVCCVCMHRRIEARVHKCISVPDCVCVCVCMCMRTAPVCLCAHVYVHVCQCIHSTPMCT